VSFQARRITPLVTIPAGVARHFLTFFRWTQSTVEAAVPAATVGFGDLVASSLRPVRLGIGSVAETAHRTVATALIFARRRGATQPRLE
jgi:hypothetical protein